MKSKFTFIGLLGLILVAAAFAADLTYTTAPQSGDSDLVLRNKGLVAMARLERGNTYANVSTNGTNNYTGPVILDRLVVGTAGATSTLTLSDVSTSATNAIATISTTNQVSLPLGVRVEGTLRAVTAGGTPANVTLSYR